MKVNNLYKDPTSSDNNYPPDLTDVIINSSSEKIFGTMLTAQGEGPHPTMLLVHGVPGTEKNFDIAQALRRTGWNILIFHYRGTWGSQGDFSFVNAIDDVEAAFGFLKSEEAIKKFRIDDKNIVLAGNSFGGFAALLSAARGLDAKAYISICPYDFGLVGEIIQKDNETMSNLTEMLKDLIVPTKGATVESLINEMIENSSSWNLINNAAELSKHKLLIIAGNKDSVSPPDLHYYPLIAALNSNNAENLNCHLLDTNHGFQDRRILLTEIIANWLSRQMS